MGDRAVAGRAVRGGTETSLHAMRDYAKEVWRKLVPSDKRSFFYIPDLDAWLWLNLKSHGRKQRGILWCVVFGVARWSLWKVRNQKLFSPGVGGSSVDDIRRAAMCFSNSVVRVSEGLGNEMQTRELQGCFRWNYPPVVGGIKLNTNVAYGEGRIWEVVEV
ncbi:uncharacterized protein LOC114726831 [Neltuma alba]|uniref:uncharacterized protein LOC114726831 n=1 Tax=Neltuma alba TaxID=207710 RepID=UPI0010A56B0E|nr:uncharacterized protein LOC114726831 [Prosopis alba]